MLFNSIDFAVFLPAVFILYWFVTNRSLKLQNLLIVAAGFVFYGWWDIRFLLLLVFSGLVDYLLAIRIYKSSKPAAKNLFLSLSLITNLGILIFFKYFNFFEENFIAAFQVFGYKFSSLSLKIILPIGISFYIFKTISYILDVNRGKLKPTTSLVDYMAYLGFFPQLFAGPIDRATNLLPQFSKKRTFSCDAAVDGLKQILWGLFKKVVIADSCAVLANNIFDNSEMYPGSTLAAGALFFTIQIYADFSGYSDIAIGTARLFGFNTMRNFAFPYFSRDIIEFWRRWHISLSGWLMDYVFTPLSLKWRDWGYAGTATALVLTFILCGFWHGANWTFIIWGLLNALYFIPAILLKSRKKQTNIVAKGRMLPSAKETAQIIFTFTITVFAWIFFRANNLDHALQYVSEIFSGSIFSIPRFKGMSQALRLSFFIVVFFIIEWKGRENQYAFERTGENWFRPFKWGMYYSFILTILYFAEKEQQFIYFRF